MLTKIALFGTVSSLCALAAFSSLQNVGNPAHGNVTFPALAGLAGLVGVGASAPTSAGGPIDRTFTAKRVHTDKIVAQMELVTIPSGPIRVQATGAPDTLKELQVRIVGDEVFIRLDKEEEEAWFPWNLFNMWSRERKVQDLRVRISAPSGTPYDIEDMTGSIAAGDLDAPLSLDGHSMTARFGRVQSAKVSVAGSGKITLGAIKENLDLEIAGSGRIEAVSAAAAQIEIAGGGDVVIGPLTGGLNAEIAGAGDVRVASINGPMSVSIAGSGSVLVDGGQASSFEVEIAGSGDVVFKGNVVDPKVDIMGSGDVTVGSYSGNLDQEIAGSGDFKVMRPGQQPAVPTPPPSHP